MTCRGCQATYGPMMTPGVLALALADVPVLMVGIMATVLGLFDRSEYGPMTVPSGLLCLTAGAAILLLMFKRTPRGWRKPLL